MSWIVVIIWSDIGLVPFQHQAITWTNAETLSTVSLGTNKLQWHLDQNITIFKPEEQFENLFCKMAAILFQPLYFKYPSSSTIVRSSELILHVQPYLNTARFIQNISI